MKYLIIYNEEEVMSISLFNGGDILSNQTRIVTTLEQAKIMLEAINIDTKNIDNYNPETI